MSRIIASVLVSFRARTLREKGLTASEIAEALGVGHNTVFRYLRMSKPA